MIAAKEWSTGCGDTVAIRVTRAESYGHSAANRNPARNGHVETCSTVHKLPAFTTSAT